MPSFIKFLSSVVVPKTTIIAGATVNAANMLNLGVDVYITSGNDGLHRQDSKHYTDEALDIRTKNMTTVDKHRFVTELKRRLGKHYDVILEDEGGVQEHCHVEHDPK